LSGQAVRAAALEAGLATAEKRESMGICMVGPRNFGAFIGQYVTPTPGRFKAFDAPATSAPATGTPATGTPATGTPATGTAGLVGRAPRIELSFPLGVPPQRPQIATGQDLGDLGPHRGQELYTIGDQRKGGHARGRISCSPCFIAGVLRINDDGMKP
jgi:tRNA U34 2-thiouridine synthase MnmA/TrmU